MRCRWLWLLLLVTLGACKPDAASKRNTDQVPPKQAPTASTTGRSSGSVSSNQIVATTDSAVGLVGEVVVDGDVSASLIDAAGRHSGWEGHKVENIPGCTVDVLESEVAEPTHCRFTWNDGVDGEFQLILTPRTQGKVFVKVRAASSAGTKCEKPVTAELSDDAVASWLIQLKATRTECHAEVVMKDRR